MRQNAALGSFAFALSFLAMFAWLYVHDLTPAHSQIVNPPGNITATLSGPLPAGSNNIGSVNIANQAAPPGDNIIGPTAFTSPGTITVNSQGSGSVAAQATGTGTGLSYAFQATVDGTNYFTVTAYTTSGQGQTTSNSQTGNWTIPTAGYQKVRINLTAISGGTVNFTLESSAGSAQPNITISTPPNDVAAGPTSFTGTGNLAVNSQGSGSVGVQATGSGTGLTFNFQATIDNSNWFSIPCVTVTTAAIVTSGSANGNWTCQSAGYRQVRVNLAAIGGGTETFTLNASAGSDQPPVGTQGTSDNITGINGTAPGISNGLPTSVNTGNALTVPHICGSAVTKHITTMTDTQIVAASGSTNIYICDYEFSFNGTGNIYLEKSSTGTCGSPTQIGQTWYGVANFAKAAGNPYYRGFNTGASQQLCVNTSAAVPVDITVYYDQY